MDSYPRPSCGSWLLSTMKLGGRNTAVKEMIEGAGRLL